MIVSKAKPVHGLFVQASSQNPLMQMHWHLKQTPKQGGGLFVQSGKQKPEHTDVLTSQTKSYRRRETDTSDKKQAVR